MSAGIRRSSAAGGGKFRAVLAPLLMVLGVSVDCAGSDPMTGMIAAGSVGMSQPKLVYLRPGLRIAKKAPQGWTHLVMKSIPRLSSGELGSLPAGSAKTATLFRSVLLANVKPVDFAEKDFELTQLGIGICIPDPQDEEQDIVVTAETLDALGLRHLTTVQRMVLDAAEDEMSEGRIIARTATFALFRSPVTVLDPGGAGKHSKANIHYAFCANRTTGRLDVIVWTTKPGTVAQHIPAMVKLKPSAVFQCELDVRARRILGTVPYSWSFAMRDLPPGGKLRVPPAMGAQVIEASRHPAQLDPDDLELILQKLIPAPADSDLAGEHTVVPRRDAPCVARQSHPLIGGQSNDSPARKGVAVGEDHSPIMKRDFWPKLAPRLSSERIMPVGRLTRRTECRWLVITVTFLYFGAATTPAWAWGRIGHRVIAQLAEKQLSDQAKAAIAGLLAPGESLADASLWADEHRRELPKTAPWHYVDVPLDEPRYHSVFAGDLPQRGYVVDKIHDFKVVVKDSSRSLEDRRIALRFLIHFVEDVHMPMHVGDNNDKGGNRDPGPVSSTVERTCTVSGIAG